MPSTKNILFMAAVFLALISGDASRASGQTLDRDTKFRLAQGLEKAGELDRAASIYRELYQQDPNNAVVFDGLQRVLVQLKHYDDVIAILVNRLSANPHDVNILGLLGNVYYKSGHETEANQEWEKILALDPKNATLYRVVASILVENRLLDRAAEIYHRGRAAIGDSGLYAIDLAQLLVATMEYTGATIEYLRWLDQNPAQLAFVENRMATFTAKPDGRRLAIDAVDESLRSSDEPRRYELLGWLYLEGNEFEMALNSYRAMDRLSGRHGQAICEFAERAQKARAYEIAARAFQEAIEAPLPQSRLPFALYGYACALRDLGLQSDSLRGPFTAPDSNGQGSTPLLDKAMNSYRAIIRDYPHTEFSAKSWYQIADLQADRFFDLNSALNSLASASKELAGVTSIRQELLLKEGNIWLLKGDTARAAEQYRAVATTPSATPDQIDEASFRLAELDYFAGRFPDASQHLNAIALNVKADYANDAIELQTFLTENSLSPPDALKQYSHAEFLARQRRNSEAVKILHALVAAYPMAPLVDDALMSIASLEARSGYFDDAIVTYEKVLTEFKDQGTLLDRAQFRIGELFQYGLHNMPKAVTAYEALLSNFPHSIFLDEARKRIRQLRGEAL